MARVWWQHTRTPMHVRAHVSMPSHYFKAPYQYPAFMAWRCRTYNILKINSVRVARSSYLATAIVLLYECLGQNYYVIIWLPLCY